MTLAAALSLVVCGAVCALVAAAVGYYVGTRSAPRYELHSRRNASRASRTPSGPDGRPML